MHADVAIVGGGVIGLASALRLAEAGLRIAVIEPGSPGGSSGPGGVGAATWAAGGILGAQMESEGPGPMLELCLASRALWPGFAAELGEKAGLDVHHSQCGILELAFSEREEAHLRATQGWQSARGLSAQLLPAPECRERGAPADVSLGLFLPDDAQVDNRRVAAALRTACARARVEFVHAEARALHLRAGRVHGVLLRGEGEPVHSAHVLVAAGGWSALLGQDEPDHELSFLRAVRPVRGQVIALAARVPFAQVMGSAAGYVVPRRDGRLLAGATVEESGFDASTTAEGLARMRAVVARLCPSLADAPLLEHWAGLRPGSRDGLPLLGAAGPKGLVVATGHYRNGILLAPITAELVRALVLGADPRLDLRPFDPGRFAASPVASLQPG